MAIWSATEPFAGYHKWWRIAAARLTLQRGKVETNLP
jgi:hypothetical protein